jgi:hypothetical protein
VVYFCIGKQKVVWILKLRENGWEAAASALTSVNPPGPPPANTGSAQPILKIVKPKLRPFSEDGFTRPLRPYLDWD